VERLLTFLTLSSSQPVAEWIPTPGVYHASYKIFEHISIAETSMLTFCHTSFI
jgi:hypothetical protein